MPTYETDQSTHINEMRDSSTRLRPNPPQSHTHLQQVAGCTHAHTRRSLMELDRGALAKIDRKLLSGLGHEKRYRTARIPASDPVWAAWRRYCSALGLSMGRGIVTLIVHELGVTLTDHQEDQVLLSEFEERFLARAEELDRRERRLEERERSLREAERLLKARAMPMPPHAPDVGRNDPCPCGSDFKYKRCHGV